MFDIKVEKKKTEASKISNFKNMKNNEYKTSESIGIDLKSKTIKNNNASRKTTINIQIENPKNFHKINSYLFIGLDKIRKIVFHSISLKRSWLQIKSTLKNQKISIIASQKSSIILSSSHIVNFPKAMEKIIKINAKNIIR